MADIDTSSIDLKTIYTFSPSKTKESVPPSITIVSDTSSTVSSQHSLSLLNLYECVKNIQDKLDKAINTLQSLPTSDKLTSISSTSVLTDK